MPVTVVPDVTSAELQMLGLLAIMPPWSGGTRWPDVSNAFEANKYINPDNLDGLFAALQQGVINVGKGVLEDRWIPSHVNVTPAEDGSYQPARIGVLNDIACRVFDDAPAKAELWRIQDFIVIQDAEDLFENYVEVEWTTESNTAAKNVGINIEIKVVGSDGVIPGSFETPIPKIIAYDSNGNRYRQVFKIGIDNGLPVRNVGDFVICNITRDNTIVDNLQDPIGIISARIV